MLRLSREPDGAGLLPTPDEERTRLGEALAEERKARALAEHEEMLVEAEDERLRAELESLRDKRR